MFDESEVRVPVYVITGFLESGKTSFINFTISQDYFQIDEPTLLITTEEGVEEYSKKELLQYRTLLEVVEKKEDFTPEYLKKLNRKYHPDRVIIEFNPLWGVKELEEMAMPNGWGIVQEIVTVDCTTFQIYLQNMRSVFTDMSRNADMVMFNRASKADPLPSFRRSIKAVNPACEVLFEDEEGEIADIFEDQMPFDLDADIIEIDDVDYGIWYFDMDDHPERYEGKTVHFKGMVLKSEKANANYFVPGRTALTCCADDTSFLGYVCETSAAKSLVMGSWVEVTAKIHFEYSPVYHGEGPVLKAQLVKPTKAPAVEMVMFN